MSAARKNPFATERIENLLRFEPEWIGESWEVILDRLDRLRWRGAVVGPHGSGKTTFLETLAIQLRNRDGTVVPLFINRQSRGIDQVFYSSLTSQSIILFDGAEQLGWFAWRRFLRDTSIARGLIITTHRPMRLPTVLETKTDPQLLERCIRRLSDDFPGDANFARELLERHSGNLRHALLDCYDMAI